MRIKDMIGALPVGKEKRAQKNPAPLRTPWGERIDPSHVWEEYPRPRMVRDGFTILNGWWNYAITKSPHRPKQFDGRILVPFSPEAPLSGVNRQLQPDEYLWYERCVAVPTLHAGERYLLHFEAVDQCAAVWVNGKAVMKHTGGYLPFTADITDFLNAGNSADFFVLTMRVQDFSDTSYHSRGKQTLTPGGMYYTAQSGIWQSVWMEVVPAVSIEDILAEPDPDQGKIHVTLKTAGTVSATASADKLRTSVKENGSVHPPAGERPRIRVRIFAPTKSYRAEIQPLGKCILEAQPDTARSAPDAPSQPDTVQTPADAQAQQDTIQFTQDAQAQQDTVRPAPDAQTQQITIQFTPDDQARQNTIRFTVDVPDVRLWDPENPWLYPIEVCLGEDRIRSYFAMRRFSKARDEAGHLRLYLNGRQIFLNGVLDQGCWPDGLYTAPSDDALIYDITQMKSLGFHLLRKHAKIECRRWYYHCDRLGMIVWQDMVNGGGRYSALLLTYLPTGLCVPGPLMKREKAAGDRTDAAAQTGRMKTSHRNTLAERLEMRITGRTDPRGRSEFRRECAQTVSLLKGHPCIMTWVLFNEGWGQFETAALTEMIRGQDPQRFVDSASGWFEHRTGDFKSVHNYFRKMSVPEDIRVNVLSEYGGIVYSVPGHCMYESTYGYHTCSSPEEFRDTFRDLLENQVLPLEAQGLCGAVYTQVSDIEEETNGLLTYDRRVCKIQ